jgi:hypothetical protein
MNTLNGPTNPHPHWDGTRGAPLFAEPQPLQKQQDAEPQPPEEQMLAARKTQQPATPLQEEVMYQSKTEKDVK